MSAWYFIALGDTCAVCLDLSNRIAPPMVRIVATIVLILELETVGSGWMYGLVWPKTFDAVKVMISIKFLYCLINDASSTTSIVSIDLASIRESTASRNASYLCFSVLEGSLTLQGLEGFLVKLEDKSSRFKCGVPTIE